MLVVELTIYQNGKTEKEGGRADEAAGEWNYLIAAIPREVSRAGMVHLARGQRQSGNGDREHGAGDTDRGRRHGAQQGAR